ncbi:MAG: hypothetical protein ACOX8W_12070 [bacterium]|jgi:hypothetical protein
MFERSRPDWPTVCCGQNVTLRYFGFAGMRIPGMKWAPDETVFSVLMDVARRESDGRSALPE